MESHPDYDFIKAQFQELEKLDNLEKLDSYIERNQLDSSIDAFYTKYPEVDLRLSQADISELKSRGIISADHRLDLQNFPDNPLAKLLAAVLWKNGDIYKVQHLVDGITGREGDRTKYSLILKQYGASLASEQEPIVDQHVLRAFEIYSLKEGSFLPVHNLKRKSSYKSSDRPLLNAYKAWFKKVIDKVPKSEQSDFKEKLDKVLFFLGKKVKV